jgi:transcriptional regulator with XRE-family HTH domain
MIHRISFDGYDGNKIREARKRLNLRMVDLGEQIGVSRHVIWCIEKNYGHPLYRNLESICNVLGINLKDILKSRETGKD